MKIEYLELKDNLYQELVRLKKNEDLERNTMGREIQEVLDKQKQERKEFVCNQNMRLETFKANQKTELDEKDKSFEEELESKIRPRREKIESSQKRRGRIEANLGDIYQKEIFERDIPKCPCCHLPYDNRQIYNCLEGLHSICSECKPQHQTCRDCPRDSAGYPARNRNLEEKNLNFVS